MDPAVSAVAAAEGVIGAVFLYGACGLATACAFALGGAARVMPGTDRVTVGARILLIPAAAALWPLVLRRWLRARRA